MKGGLHTVPIIIIEGLILVVVGLIYFPLFVYTLSAHIASYYVIKYWVLKSRKWDLNISSGGTDGGGINADIVNCEVPNFRLIKNIYKLPFRNKQFKNVICSHTIEHVDDPEKFHRELRRISKRVTYVIPPVWDIASIFSFLDHKWQFLTLNPIHINRLPPKIKLTPWWWIRKKIGWNAGP